MGDCNGAYHGRATKNDANSNRPGSGKNDDVYAAYIIGIHVQYAIGVDVVLDD